MIELQGLTQRFEQWLDEAMPTLTPWSSIDVHIDELCERGPTAQEQLDATAALFQWIVANLARKLAGKIVMLMIPLRNSEKLDVSPPAWEALATQLSRTPPAIYVMPVTAFLQADPAQRFITTARIPSLVRPSITPYYQCWRNVDDPEEEGWARDVRIVSTTFLS